MQTMEELCRVQISPTRFVNEAKLLGRLNRVQTRFDAQTGCTRVIDNARVTDDGRPVMDLSAENAAENYRDKTTSECVLVVRANAWKIWQERLGIPLRSLPQLQRSIATKPSCGHLDCITPEHWGWRTQLNRK